MEPSLHNRLSHLHIHILKNRATSRHPRFFVAGFRKDFEASGGAPVVDAKRQANNVRRDDMEALIALTAGRDWREHRDNQGQGR